MEIFGYLAALLIGLTLGLIGGGGSILTVPILVYLLNIDPVLATAYSLFVVGFTALIGAFNFFRLELVNFKVAVLFAVPSFISVWITRAYLLPAIPEEIYRADGLIVTRGLFIMVLFALLMLIAAISMIKRKKFQEQEEKQEVKIWVVLLEGVVVGVLTGLVGAGGGFLIIPALVLFGGLSMKMAVGTSLLIIAVKSLIGFTGDIVAGQPIDWLFLALFTFIAVIGIFAGTRLSTKIDGKKLRQAFGYFVLLMSIVILINEFEIL
ncbi:MAG: sulfite exporter TauE/SafE family protein [Candidatus Cyclobacteriaceae bacterium M2_1C_046]